MFALRRLGYHAVELGRRPTGQTEHPGNTGRVAQNPSARAEAMTVPLELLALVGLIGLNAAFVAAEYGLVTSRRTRIRELADAGNRRARAVQRITADPPRFIAAMQLGVTITSLSIGALGEPLFAHLFEPVMATILAVIFSLFIVTYLHVVIGELVPKGIALGHPERTALFLSAPVRGFFTIMAPVVWLLQRSTELVLGLLGQKPPGADHSAHSEAELRMLLSSSAEQGEIDRGEQEMLYKVFDFADKEVADVMVTRPEVIALSVDLPPTEALEAVLASPYTRYPVYRETLDEIVGILHVRDLFQAMHDPDVVPIDLQGLVRPATMVPENEGPRRAPHRVPPLEPAPRGRDRRVRRGRGHRHARGPARGDRGRDRGRVRPARRDRSNGSTTTRSGSTARFSIDDFNERVRRRPAGSRTSTRSPASCSGSSAAAPSRATRSPTTAPSSSVDSVEGQRIDRLTVRFGPRRTAAVDPEHDDS